MMPGPDNDQRSIGRTHIEKGAPLFFNGQPGVRACTVINVTNRGAKIRTHDLPVLPGHFQSDHRQLSHHSEVPPNLAGGRFSRRCVRELAFSY